MTITVKEFVQKYINDSTNEDVEVNEIELQYPEFDRVDIVNAMKALENEKLGVLVVGRRNKKTRFRKGYMRVSVGLNQTAMENLKSHVLALEDGKEFPLEDGHGSSEFAAKFFCGNKNQGVEALKQLETEGLGVFLIGRRGGHSRFLKGVSREQLQNKSAKGNLVKIKPVNPVTTPIEIVTNVIPNDNVNDLNEDETEVNDSVENDQLCKYTYASGILFKSELEDDEGYDSLQELFDSMNYKTSEMDKIQQELDENGFYKLDLDKASNQ